MCTLKRLLVLIGLTALVSLVAPVPAQAQNAAACAIEGRATTNPPVQILGGSGTYKFDSSVGAGLQLNCVIGTANHGSGVVTLTVSSTGNYTNTVCGTGRASSADLDPVNPPTGGNDITAVNVRAGNLDTVWAEQQETKLEYDIDFAGTVGAFQFRAGAGNAQGIGVVLITDPTPGEFTDGVNCTSDFAVVGAWAGTLAE
jgi:hypothetical protein